MILDKLVEKKDMRAYIAWRIRLLERELGEVPRMYPLKNREPAKRQIKGRIMELNHLKKVLNDVKKESKTLCEQYYRKTREK